jgi:hypothetical protein
MSRKFIFLFVKGVVDKRLELKRPEEDISESCPLDSKFT